MCVYLGERAVTKLSVLHVEEKTINVSVRVTIMLMGTVSHVLRNF